MHNLKPATEYKILTVKIVALATLDDAEITDALNAEPTAGRFEKTPDVPFFTREQLTAYANNSRNEFTSLEMQLAQALLNEIKHRP